MVLLLGNSHTVSIKSFTCTRYIVHKDCLIVIFRYSLHPAYCSWVLQLDSSVEVFGPRAGR